MKIKIKSTENHELDVMPVQKKRSVKKNSDLTQEKVKSKKTNIHYLLYFTVVVLVCILSALIFRIVLTVKNSTFSTPSYSVLISSESPFLVSVDTDSKKLSIIEIDKKNSRSRLQKSMELKVPVDARLSKKSGSVQVSDFPSGGFLLSVLSRPWEYEFEGMTPLDAFKLTQYALGIQEKDIIRHNISISSDGELHGIEAQELYDVFKDPIIINEQQSIEVINGTGQEGLAGQVSLLIKNSGGNVVSVGSAQDTAYSVLTANKKSHTLDRISHMLGIPPVVDENFASISDIKITLGQDFVKRIK